jgi:hypothetical protein
MRRLSGNFQLGLETLVVVAALVAIRAVLWAVGVEGMEPTALASGIIAGGVFVMGLVVAGTLSDYKDAERAPTDLAAGLYSILRRDLHRPRHRKGCGRRRRPGHVHGRPR